MSLATGESAVITSPGVGKMMPREPPYSGASFCWAFACGQDTATRITAAASGRNGLVLALRSSMTAPGTPANVQSARSAGLTYVTDQAPAIRRRRRGRGFVYFDRRGRAIRRRAELDRIARLAVPPAWKEVWICESAKGHLQACGRDARGRKQYRYHPEWRQFRDEVKYDQMLAFAMALPALRRRIARDLSAHGLPRRKVIAAVVQLLE